MIFSMLNQNERRITAKGAWLLATAPVWLPVWIVLALCNAAGHIHRGDFCEPEGGSLAGPGRVAPSGPKAPPPPSAAPAPPPAKE